MLGRGETGIAQVRMWGGSSRPRASYSTSPSHHHAKCSWLLGDCTLHIVHCTLYIVHFTRNVGEVYQRNTSLDWSPHGEWPALFVIVT